MSGVTGARLRTLQSLVWYGPSKRPRLERHVGWESHAALVTLQRKGLVVKEGALMQERYRATNAGRRLIQEMRALDIEEAMS